MVEEGAVSSAVGATFALARPVRENRIRGGTRGLGFWFYVSFQPFDNDCEKGTVLFILSWS